MKYAIYKGTLEHFDDSRGKLIALCANRKEVLEVLKNNAHERNQQQEMYGVKCLLDDGALLDSKVHNFYLWAEEA